MPKMVAPGSVKLQPPKKVTPAKPETQVVKTVSVLPTGDRKDEYPNLRAGDVLVNGVVIPREKFVITQERMKKLLGWETEKEFALRVKKVNPHLKLEEIKLPDHLVMLTDDNGERVVCWNNTTNRPFREQDARKYAQEVLSRNWAGFNSMEETINGEAIVIGRTGLALSIQHRGVGFILACQTWAREPVNGHWHQTWKEEPTLESLVVEGVSEAPKVVRTLDNVITRTEADVVYTSKIFDDLTLQLQDGTLVPDKSGIRECSRMLAKAIDFTWVRSGFGTGYHKYKTHSEELAFQDRHPKLRDCVLHIFGENKDRSISKINLSPGVCAGLLYMMGSSTSDGDKYFNQDPVPDETGLNWENWDLACGFFVDLTTTTSASGKVVREALAALIDPDSGTGGRASEKLAILSKAWGKFANHENITEEDLKLSYVERDGKTLLNEPEADFGGIDRGPKKSEAESDPEVTEQEAQAAKADVDQKKLERLALIKQKAEERKAKKAAENGEPKTGIMAWNPPDGKTQGDKPLPRLPTRAEVQAQQTEKARKADEQLAKEKAGKPATLKPGNSSK